MADASTHTVPPRRRGTPAPSPAPFPAPDGWQVRRLPTRREVPWPPGKLLPVLVSLRHRLVLALLALLSGTTTGLSLAAGGLAIAGQTLAGLSAEQATLFLVLGPFLGLLPVSALAALAASRPYLAAHLPWVLALWLVLAIATSSWFGLRPLLR
ncbi:MAG TPA: hypothetical protein VHS99_12035 [Chloroflexota bacterium]|nr:hypothetical protein [Chloroflexota bacterium]